ncbi:MAG: DUF87 domain-containing protein [Ilumatobacteraceae bacterium]
MAELFLGETIDASGARTGDRVLLPSGDLTTHGVIVGMTGSGKTGLGVVLIEECLRNGIPTLLIDPKGDLGNLLLTFPDLSGPDFRPWINEGDAAKAGVTPDQFAADQAAMWSKGLGDWGLSGTDIGALRAATDFTIYTPGSSAGVPVNIVGSLQAPADQGDLETMRDEIEGYVSGLLAMIGLNADPLASREHILISNLIENSWTAGKDLDLATLVGQVGTPPLRKLGVFDLDTFFPPADRMALAMKLNGLLASPAFSSWAMGQPLDIESLLHTADGKPRCAIVSTAHLSDDERQFVTTLVLSKLVTWMRKQSGTSDLRALLYMDEVAGYLPPTAVPPTKKPIMLLMKQARAFGVGVVLSTQNPVDVDYKAISNAGTWMIGRLQTERDKSRLLEGLSAADGGVDVSAVSDSISNLGKRQFMLRRAGKSSPSTFTTRWAMSYLRGPFSRDQIAAVTAAHPAAAGVAASATAPSAPTAGAAAPSAGSADSGAPAIPDDCTTVMPAIASGIAVRYVDVAAPWLDAVGGDDRGEVLEAALVARVALRYDETKADLVHDEEYEAVLYPLGDRLDLSRVQTVDYDDRDLRDQPQTDQPVYRLPALKLDAKTTFTQAERDLVDHLVRSRALEISANAGLKLYSRPGESPAEFERRCASAADDAADAEVAKLRDKYEAKAKSLQDKIASAEDKIELLEEQKKGRKSEELLSAAGSLLGGLLGGKRNTRSLAGKVLGGLGGAAGRRSRSSQAEQRLDSAEDKLKALHEDLEDLETELAEEIDQIHQAWDAKAAEITTMPVTLEKNDVSVTELVLAWMPARA